ncbi:hypothetical protein DH2020_039569 [Rehmannia glutinosa]|uniref:Reverse transcriptase domain-containing protein n=1 Tax=Rehmannia glutinosa TaxID=99300 RepID=A0ABR0UWL9_REHGL
MDTGVTNNKIESIQGLKGATDSSAPSAPTKRNIIDRSSHGVALPLIAIQVNIDRVMVIYNSVNGDVNESAAIVVSHRLDQHGRESLYMAIEAVSNSNPPSIIVVNWLKYGDRNSNLFHGKVTSKRAKGVLCRLVVDDMLTEDRQLIRNHILSFYEKLFSEQIHPGMDYSMVDEMIQTTVTDVENNFLCAIPSDEEIKEAIFGMSPDSAPRPDGFGGHFYKQFWDTIARDIAVAVRSFFVIGVLPTGCNSSFMVLVPKSKGDDRVEEFKPIIWSNFLFKTVTKILASRFGSILKKLVSEMQYGFIPGKKIHDCIALASEGVNCLMSNSRRRNMILKIDIHKA